MITRIVLAAAVAALGVTAVIAQSDPIAARKALMKDNGAQFRLITEMAQEKQPFNLAAAKKAFTTIADSTDKAKALFPANSQTGDTAALPAIWEKKADFDAKFDQLRTAAKAADAKVKDLATLKAEQAEFGKNCGGCHQPYRKRQS
jgi:cytochrome c556